jgi:parvulin-like peptidyl-prolyl isomerase
MLNLPLPWRRSADAVEEEPPESTGRRPARRRGGRNRRIGAASGEAVAAARERRRRESRRQRIALLVGAVLILIIVGVVSFGVYQQFIRPPHVMAGEVRGVRFSMGDLVERIRVLQGINRYQGGQVDFSRIPFQLLQDLVHAEILRQAAPGLQINVTDELIDESIKSRFRPEAQPGEEVDDAQLDAEFENNYANFLTQVNLSDGAYRRIVEEQLQEVELFARMLGSVPEEAPHVEIQVIAMGVNSTAVPEAVKERLELGENFSSVAAELSGSDGYIGWVPEKAFPEFDPYLFGTDEKPAKLGPGEVSNQIYVDETIFLLQAIGETETRDLSQQMMFRMASSLVDEWKADQLSQGSDQGWAKINIDSHLYAWVTDQVRLTRPRVTPQPQQ